MTTTTRLCSHTELPSDVAPSRLRYEFMNDNELELEARIIRAARELLTYHRHSVAHRCLLTRTRSAIGLPRMGT